nr:transposase [Methyloprofundus sp.]
MTGKEMTYLSNHWKKLNVYCTHGKFNISNILAENAIRPFVIGRKARLFSNTPAQVLTALPYADTVDNSRSFVALEY